MSLPRGRHGARDTGLTQLRLVGLDSGMMIGRFACAARRRTTYSVKARSQSTGR